jgi:D-alanine-D-alanine ligase-like ATP-grasp enzyme
VVNNVLVGFFKADPPFVVGDRKKSIKDLILEKNKNRDEKISEILIDEELLSFIKRQSYTIDSVLPSGVMIYLLAKTGRFYGGYTKEMINEIHPKIHDIFSKASKFVSVPVAGFDFIIEDPTKDPSLQRCGIIECNSLPFIDLHYYPFEGKPVNVAKYIWDLWEEKK